MLEQLRQNSRSFIIWILFGIIIAVFVINFGPQAGRNETSCGAPKQFAMTVKGTGVSIHSWRFAMNGLGFGSGSGKNAAQNRQVALDFLLERELLAQAAEERGFRVSDDQVNKAIASGDFYVLGQRVPGAKMYFKEGVFDYGTLERYASSVGLPGVAYLVEEQRREHLAEMMRQTLVAGARVSDEEARQFYISENTKITAEYVKFDVGRYKLGLVLGDDALKAWAGRHAEVVKKLWDTEKSTWASDKPRLRLRQIYVARPAPLPPEPAPGSDVIEGGDKTDKTAGDKGTADKTAADKTKPADPVAAARAKIDGALARIKGGADFADVARAVSEDKATRGRGGAMGWRLADHLGFGPELKAAADKLTPGQVSDVIETATGFYLIQLEAKSDKALGFEEVEVDLAARLAPDAFATRLARADADAALARARTTPLEEMFDKQTKPDLPEGQGLPPGITPEDIMNSIPKGAVPGQQGGPEGALYHESDDILAEGGAGAAASPAPAATSPAPAATTPPADDEPLPAVVVDKPGLQNVGPVARNGDFLAGIGSSTELVDALFGAAETGQVLPKVYEVDDGQAFVVVKLVDRSLADLAKFDTDKADLVSMLEDEKARQIVYAWISARCEEASRSGAVSVDRKYVSPDDDKPVTYSPCKNLSYGTVAQQLDTRTAH